MLDEKNLLPVDTSRVVICGMFSVRLRLYLPLASYGTNLLRHIEKYWVNHENLKNAIISIMYPRYKSYEISHNYK